MRLSLAFSMSYPRIKNNTPPTTFKPATEIPKKLNNISPPKAKATSVKKAVINDLIAVSLLPRLSRLLVMLKKTGITPRGFMRVRNEVM